MKTNQVMLRPMGCFSVEQRTKDGMFNATNLLDQWNRMVEANMGNPIFKKRSIADFFRLDQTKEFIEALIEEENLNTQNSAYLKSRGKNGGTWMHPILFVKFAMWLNPRFEVKVIKFIYDQMIFFRNEAGDAYKALASAVSKTVVPNFMKVAMKQIAEGLNWCVFNQHETAIRNQHGVESKMRELFELERRVASLIDDGFLKSHKETMAYLRKQWQKKYNPKVFIENN